MPSSRVIVVGAGPAGLSAALELVDQRYSVTVLESDPQYVGGLARTISYKGFRFDIGAHRFFSKNPEITRWWRERLPNDFVRIKRLTRILYRNHFFHYPLRAGQALFGLGVFASAACVLSYLRRRLVPIRPERSFEDWVRNRFGDRLFRIFFKTYTEKVWGMQCNQISADWASQRIRGLSLLKAMFDSLGFRQNTVKTLTQEFDYPRFGAGMMWEKARNEILEHGGNVVLGRKVIQLKREGDSITCVRTATQSGEIEDWCADEFIISMPLRDCVASITPALPARVLEAASGLSYRDFILVALIVRRAKIFPDNWVYIHEPKVKVGRIDNFRNWTPEMVPNPESTCLVMEYFCSQGDNFWEQEDENILQTAKSELEALGLAKSAEVFDGCVVRVEKAYPVYDDSFRTNVNVIREALAPIRNLQPVGRNGMHKYNNQDHAMLTGMLAARNVAGGQHDLWCVNTDTAYLEEQSNDSSGSRLVPEPIRSVKPVPG